MARYDDDMWTLDSAPPGRVSRREEVDNIVRRFPQDSPSRADFVRRMGNHYQDKISFYNEPIGRLWLNRTREKDKYLERFREATDGLSRRNTPMRYPTIAEPADPDTWYNLRHIPLLPPLPKLSPGDWKRLDIGDPAEFGSEVYGPGYKRSKKSMSLDKFKKYGSITQVLRQSPHKTMPISLDSIDDEPSGHSNLTTLLPDGTVRVWDPHGTTFDDTNPDSFSKAYRHHYENALGDVNIETSNVQIQRDRGTCKHITNLYKYFPELTPEQFRELLETTAEQTGLIDAFPGGRDPLDYLDLLPMLASKRIYDHSDTVPQGLNMAQREAYRESMTGRAKPKKKK